MMAMARCKCGRCKAEWFPRTEAPVKCPRCGSLRWNADNEPRGALADENQCPSVGGVVSDCHETVTEDPSS